MKKIFLTLTAEYGKDGSIRPISFLWEDEQVAIEHIVNVIDVEHAKDGGIVNRFTCTAQGKQFYLFFDEQRWYIERE